LCGHFPAGRLQSRRNSCCGTLRGVSSRSGTSLLGLGKGMGGLPHYDGAGARRVPTRRYCRPPTAANARPTWRRRRALRSPSAPALWILSWAQLERQLAELSQAVLDALHGAIEEMNKMKRSAVYKEIAQYGRGHCYSMLTNLKTDVHAGGRRRARLPRSKLQVFPDFICRRHGLTIGALQSSVRHHPSRLRKLPPYQASKGSK
jgi:hypothetical protein